MLFSHDLWRSLQVVGTLLPGPAEELGLSTDVIVSAGCGDNAASALGVGAVSHGEWQPKSLLFVSLIQRTCIPIPNEYTCVQETV